MRGQKHVAMQLKQHVMEQCLRLSHSCNNTAAKPKSKDCVCLCVGESVVIYYDRQGAVLVGLLLIGNFNCPIRNAIY